MLFFLLAGVFIFAGIGLLCGTVSGQVNAWWSLAGAFCLFTGYWFTVVARRSSGETGTEKLSRPITENPPITAEQPERNSRYQASSTVKIIVGITVGVVLICAAAVTIIFFLIYRTTTEPYASEGTSWWKNSSIGVMNEMCPKQVVYYEPETWMNNGVSSGVDMVFALTGKGPNEEAPYLYNLYLQVDPDLIKTDTQIEIPSKGVLAVLIKKQTPYIYCSTDITGNIQFLKVEQDSIEIVLDIHSNIGQTIWKYSGELLFRQLYY